MSSSVILMDMRLAPGLVVLLFLIGCGCSDREATSEGRLREVAEAGARVMPFDLERTTHVFSEEPWGGEQRVISDHAEAEQVALVRSHLAEEAERFARGDFTSPARIHGHDMPGLDVLRASAQMLEIRYTDVENGGSIAYRSQDPRVIAALHAWFSAQRADHGPHAAH